MKSKFFVNIARELRAPLTLILGPVQRLLEKYPKTDDSTEYKVIQKNGLRLQNLINQLLDLSKMEAGKLTLKAAETDIIALSKAILSTFESHAHKRHITLKFKSKFKSLGMYLDFDKYEKILINLLFNAFKFSEDGTEISITIFRKDKNISVQVIDQGIGIAADQIGHIFERFYQVEASSTRSYEGSGIGLALVKDLVELHYGQIEVESLPGKGTTFRMLFPMGKDHLSENEFSKLNDNKKIRINSLLTDEDDVAPLSEPDAGLPLILIVEDNADMRKYIHGFLKNNYSVIFANDGLEGYEKAKDKTPDIIVSDVMMPKMDGFEMCGKLKTDIKTSHIPIIILTAKADEEHKLEGLEIGADDYLFKPFSGKELRVRIKNLLEQRRQLQQKFATSVFISPHKLDVGKTDKSFLDDVLSAIDTNISNPDFHVDDLASKVALSRPQLHRKLKALVNKFTTEFMRSYRLQKAATLLSEKVYNIGEIAFRVGFSNLSYFSDCFRKQYGVLPSDYK